MSRLDCCFVCGRILLGFALTRQLGMVTPRRVSPTLANPTLETTRDFELAYVSSQIGAGVSYANYAILGVGNYPSYVPVKLA